MLIKAFSEIGMRMFRPCTFGSSEATCGSRCCNCGLRLFCRDHLISLLDRPDHDPGCTSIVQVATAYEKIYGENPHVHWWLKTLPSADRSWCNDVG